MRSIVDGNSMHAPVNQINQTCEHCSGQHVFGMCPFVDVNNIPMEQAQVVGSFPRSNNRYSNTYNPGWRNHPNFSWRNDQQGHGMGQGIGQGTLQPPQQQSYQQGPPGFYQPRYRPPPPQQQQQQPQPMGNAGGQNDQMSQFMAETRSSIRSLETQIGQLATLMAN